MKTLIWGITWIAVAVWSALCWLAHMLIGAGGAIIGGNADAVPDVPPEIVEWVSWLAYAGASVGEWLMVIVWAAVTALMLGLGYFLARLASARRPASARSS